MAAGLAQGQSLDQQAKTLADQIKAEHGVTDLDAYVAQLRDARPSDAPVPVLPKPAATNQADRDAVGWLTGHLGPNGRISSAEIDRSMPDGPGKQAVLRNFDALMFGYIDRGSDGWSNLFTGDVDRMRQAVNDGQSLDQLAGVLKEQLEVERGVTDLPTYVAQLRGNAPAPSPAPAGNGTADQQHTTRMQHELQVYLDDPNNQGDNAAALSLIKDHPEYAKFASPAQRAQLIGLAIDSNVGATERQAALSVLKMADERGELQTTLQALDQRHNEMKRLMSHLDDNAEGHQFVQLLLNRKLYQQPFVYSAMDDDASTALCKVLGFKHPMVGTSDQLQALPEEAKYHMIKELTGGFVSWNELYEAQWINQHTDIRYRIPDYLTQNQNGFDNNNG